jgi:CelD/BcsL family acetyltransferase involved in cellulose biosynthesis
MPVIQSLHRLESLRDEWNTLADLQACPLLRHEWTLAAARTLHAPDELRVVVQTDGEGRLSAVAPLARVGRITGRLGLVGADSLGEPMGLLAADRGARAALYEELFSLRVPVVLRRIATDGVDMAEMERAARQHGWWISRQTAPWLGVEFGASRGVQSMPWSKRLRHDLRRAHAKATAYGSVAVEEHAPDPVAAQEALDIFVQVETCGWKGRLGSSLATNERWRLFFRAYSILAAEAGILRFSFLRVGQRVAAAQMSVEAYRRLWVLKIGYDESLAHCSPGLQLTAAAIESARRRGLTSYEFLGNSEAWEQRWRPTIRQGATVAFFFL